MNNIDVVICALNLIGCLIGFCYMIMYNPIMYRCPHISKKFIVGTILLILTVMNLWYMQSTIDMSSIYQCVCTAKVML